MTVDFHKLVLTELLTRQTGEADFRQWLDGIISARDTEESLDGLITVAHRTSTLLAVGRQLSDVQSVDVLLSRMASLCTEVLGVERCTLFLHDRETDELFTRASVDSQMSEVRFSAVKGIAGSVFVTGRAAMIEDAYEDRRFNPEIDRKTGFRTRNILCVPITWYQDGRSDPIGVVQLVNKHQGSFTESDRELLDMILRQATPSIVNVQLYDALNRAREEEQRLHEVTSAMAQELHLKPLLRKIMNTVKPILEAERATIFMHDKRTRELWTIVTDEDSMSEVRLPDDQGIVGATLTSGQAINIPYAYRDPRFNRQIDRRTGFRTRNILCMPISDKSGAIQAIMQVLNKRGGPFTERDEQRLAAFCAQAAIALENARLFDEVLQVKNYNESVLQSISNAVITLDDKSCITKLNRSAVRLLRLSDAEASATGVSASQCFGEANKWLIREIKDVQRTGETKVLMDAELSVPKRSDATRMVKASVNSTVLPLQDTKGNAIGCVLMLEDITKEKRLKGALARYMSPEVAKKLLQEGGDALGGKMQLATVLFSDIRGFTSISERIGPSRTVAMLNEHFGIMVDRILEVGGVLDKYIGDSIMAVFGVPFASADDADRALRAAIAMWRDLLEFNVHAVERGDEQIFIGIGINTDEVVSGNIGSTKRMDFTVIGDGVNLASRLEGANKQYGTHMLVSEFTVRDVKGTYWLREVDLIRVRGKERSIRIYEVLDHLVTPTERGRIETLITEFERGLKLYRARDWTAAYRQFERALTIRPDDGLVQTYLARCRELDASPPPDDWDGVWTLLRK